MAGDFNRGHSAVTSDAKSTFVEFYHGCLTLNWGTFSRARKHYAFLMSSVRWHIQVRYRLCKQTTTMPYHHDGYNTMS